MLKMSLFFFEEFSYITSFTADRYSHHDPLWLFDLYIWSQIHNMAGRGLITGWPSTRQGKDSDQKIAFWLILRQQVRCGMCSGMTPLKKKKHIPHIL